MIGGGIFSLPQNMAARAEVGAVLIGWGITAIGMLTLAFVFQTLANRNPNWIQAYMPMPRPVSVTTWGSHPRLGLLDQSAWMGNVGYFVLLFSTLGYFFRRSARAIHRWRSAAHRCCYGRCISW